MLGLSVAAASVWAAPGLHGVFGAGLGLLMFAIAVVDARHFIIPDPLTALAFALALVNAGFSEWDPVIESVLMAVVRGTVVAVAFLALRVAYRRIRHRQGIGLGDVKLGGVAGAWLGWTTIPIAVEVAAFAALAIYILLQVIGGRPIRSTGRLPFGCFFGPAIWLGWLFEAMVNAS